VYLIGDAISKYNSEMAYLSFIFCDEAHVSNSNNIVWLKNAIMQGTQWVEEKY